MVVLRKPYIERYMKSITHLLLMPLQVSPSGLKAEGEAGVILSDLFTVISFFFVLSSWYLITMVCPWVECQIEFISTAQRCSTLLFVTHCFSLSSRV